MNPEHNASSSALTVSGFRQAAPYIHAFRGKTFVIAIDAALPEDVSHFTALIHDLALLHSLGVRLVLVHDHPLPHARALPLAVTDGRTLDLLRSAAGQMRSHIEALLSMGLPNTPMAGAVVRVVSGNFVIARPLGILDGLDYQHSGQIRRIEHQAIRRCQEQETMVLLPPLGYSPSGECFALAAQEVAAATARALQAEKLIYLLPHSLHRGRKAIRELNLDQARTFIRRRRRLPPHVSAALQHALETCSRGVRRCHLVDCRADGALLLELFTRDGCGTMISADSYEDLRPAAVDDIGGIIELIAPLEARGFLVSRPREVLERDLKHFIVVERDGMIIACAALIPFPGEGMGEIGCLAVHPQYHDQGYGRKILEYLERKAAAAGLHRLFVLTTQALHWFREQGFRKAELAELPIRRQDLYNYQRRSRTLIKDLGEG